MMSVLCPTMRYAVQLTALPAIQFDNAGIASTRFPGASDDIRTDGPGTVSTLTITHPIIGQGHKIDAVSLSFR